MIVLCTGMFRSASTWSFNIVKSIIYENDPNSTLYSEFNEFIKPIIQNEQNNFDNIVLKCHKVDNFGKDLIENNQVKVVYTYRNPMEAIASGMQVFNRDFEEALSIVKESIYFLQFQKSFPNVCLISYENIINHPLSTIKKICHHLEIDLESKILEKINSNFQKNKVKKIITKISKNDEDIIDIGFSYYKKDNLFHKKHIRDDDAPSWQEYLSLEQQQRARQVLSPYLENNGNLKIN